jgi:tRNA threonylcarbamoyladenosine biosynthesis protein TsaB
MRVWQGNCPIMGHVLILALDTSSPAGSLAVLRDDKVIGTVSTATEEIYSSRMFRHLEFLLKDLSLGLDEFDLFAVAAGPGSFTGLRVGLAAVKGWAEAYRKPIAAVSGLEAVASQSHQPNATVVPVLNARRGQIYFGFYGRTGAAKQNRLALDGEECVTTPDEFLEALQMRGPMSDFAIVTPEPALIGDAVSRYETLHTPAAQVQVHMVSPLLAPHVGRIGYLRALSGDVVDSLTLDANYVRRTDAELHWKAPKGS